MLLNTYKLGRLCNIVASLSNIYSGKIFYWRICVDSAQLTPHGWEATSKSVVNTGGLCFHDARVPSSFVFSSVMMESWILSRIHKHTRHRSQKQHLLLYSIEDQAWILLVGLCYQIVPGQTDRKQFVTSLNICTYICLYNNFKNYYHCVTPAFRSIWSKSSSNWERQGNKNMISHISLSTSRRFVGRWGRSLLP